MRTRLLAMMTLLGAAVALPAWAQTAVTPTEKAPVSPTDQVTPTGEAAPAPAKQKPAGGQVGESCRSRADCHTGLRCVQQVCRSIHEGAACQGDAQCPDQLVCLQNRCASRFSAAATPTAAAAAAPDQPAPAGPKAVADSEIRLTGTHLIVGASLGGGMTYWKVNNLTFNDPVLGEITQDLSTTKAALMIVNFHLGIMFDRLELSFEAAPVTWMPIVDTGTLSRDPILSVLFNVGYFFHIKRDFYWRCTAASASSPSTPTV